MQKLRLTISGGVTDCCATANIRGFYNDGFLSVEPSGLKVMESDLKQAIKEARSRNKSILTATTNWEQRKAALLLKKLGFKHSKWAKRKEPEYSRAVRLHYLELN